MMTPEEIKQIRNLNHSPMCSCSFSVRTICDTALALWEVVEAAKEIASEMTEYGACYKNNCDDFEDIKYVRLISSLKKLEGK